uniref:C3H1-type domain-containing protein n=1 Tax=Zooxanthella nutricula TaxID=1333877 RepID=A0A6U6JDY3_9DINO|mmetsp:Transcript_22936/g.68950  ORF Transcript_22936/g.68950 Transcript_22936/m.68950 type:complete len:192 (+) Transcript_22936:68-643(+)
MAHHQTPSAMAPLPPLPPLLPFRPPPGLTLDVAAAWAPPASACKGGCELNLCAAWRSCASPGGAAASDCSTSTGSPGPSSPASSGNANSAGRGAVYTPGLVLQREIASGCEPTVQLSLQSAVAVPAAGTADCPSVGSAAHWAGLCRPCDFFHRGRCTNGAACKYCHLCGKEAMLLRSKAKRMLRKARAAAA